MIKSNELRIYVDGSIISGEVTSGLSFRHDLTEVTTKPTSGFKEFTTGQKSTTFNFDGIFSSFSDLLEIGNTYDVRIGTIHRGLVGRAIMQDLSIDAGTNDSIKFSGVLELTGELTNFAPDVEAQNLQDRSGENITRRNGDVIQINRQIN